MKSQLYYGYGFHTINRAFLGDQNISVTYKLLLLSYVLATQSKQPMFPTEGTQHSIGHVQPNDDFFYVLW